MGFNSGFKGLKVKMARAPRSHVRSLARDDIKNLNFGKKFRLKWKWWN